MKRSSSLYSVRSIDGHGRRSTSRPVPSSSGSPSAVDHVGLDPGNGRVGRAGLGGEEAGQRGDHDRAGLGLPPRVDDRAAAAADDLVVPQPGLRVDRLAHRPEQPQRRQVVLVRVLGAPLHAGADRGRRGVEDRDAVVLDELPPHVLVRVVGRPLPHHRRRPVGQRPVDDVGVAGHPADVGRAPVDVVLRLEVEDEPVGVGDAGQVAARGVQDALRLGRRAATCRGCTAGARRPSARPGTPGRRRRRSRGTRGRGRPASRAVVAVWRTTTIVSRVQVADHLVDLPP